MLTVDNVDTAQRERILRGQDHWWFLGPGGIAKLTAGHLNQDRTLTEQAEQSLRNQGLFDVAAYQIYSLTVLTSTDCNLGCAYCFQNISQDPTGGSRPPRIQHARLTSDAIDRILRFTGDRMERAELGKLGIMLFGGEPLLNFKGCRELLARAADYGLASANMISNGVLMTPLMARTLFDLGLRTVQITFDGDQADHDAIRVRRSGGGTFDAIVDNVARAAEVAPLRWEFRVNVSHHNAAGVDRLIERLSERLDLSRCGIYFARVGDVGIGYANDLLHTGQLAEDFIGWNRRAIEQGFGVVRPAAKAACQACSHPDGRYGAVVNPDGTLYSCWETSGRPGFDVGTVDDGYRAGVAADEHWLTCADKYQYSEDIAALDRFQDTVDAALLDDLSRVGRL